MASHAIVTRAFAAFGADTRESPPLSLRGGNALDSYALPPPFDAAVDAPTDAYLEQHVFWGLAFLDARSWRHYLPRLIAYAFGHPDDPAMVVEAVVRSMRPPDFYPPRLGSVAPEQEEVVRAFLETLADDPRFGSAREDARLALAEWWGAHPRARPSIAELQALRAVPTTYRRVTGEGYQLQIPDTLVGGEAKSIPSEARVVQTWGGVIRGDVHAVVAVNRRTDGSKSVHDVCADIGRFFRVGPVPAAVDVPGARVARRIDATVFPGSPADPHAFVMIVAAAEMPVALTIRAHDRTDVRGVLALVADSFRLDVTP